MVKHNILCCLYYWTFGISSAVYNCISSKDYYELLRRMFTSHSDFDIVWKLQFLCLVCIYRYLIPIDFFILFYMSNLFKHKNLIHRTTWIWCLFPFWIWYFMDYLKYSFKYEKQANVFHLYGCKYGYLCWSYSSQ